MQCCLCKFDLTSLEISHKDITSSGSRHSAKMKRFGQVMFAVFDLSYIRWVDFLRSCHSNASFSASCVSGWICVGKCQNMTCYVYCVHLCADFMLNAREHKKYKHNVEKQSKVALACLWESLCERTCHEHCCKHGRLVCAAMRQYTHPQCECVVRISTNSNIYACSVLCRTSVFVDFISHAFLW